jgi:hypothetical protein
MYINYANANPLMEDKKNKLFIQDIIKNYDHTGDHDTGLVW